MSKIKPFWLARNSNYHLSIFKEKPRREYNQDTALTLKKDPPPPGKWWSIFGSLNLAHDHPEGAGITWENEPRPVYLTPHSPEDINRLVEAADQIALVGFLADDEDYDELASTLEPFMEGE